MPERGIVPTVGANARRQAAGKFIVRLLLSGFDGGMLKCGWRQAIMDKATTFEPSAAGKSADLRAAVGECIHSIDLAREQITRDQGEIDQMQNETRTILERLQVVLPAA